MQPVMATDSELLEGLEQAVVAQPTNRALRLHLAQLLVRGQRFGDALGQCAVLLADDPGDVRARELAATATAALGDSQRPGLDDSHVAQPSSTASGKPRAG
jgi:predicted Zn-dependent protease